MENIYRKDFPIFSAKENEGLIYFDSAATSQKPDQVIEAVDDYYKKNNANPLRGLYDLSVRATDEYENARHACAEFINAKEDCEIIFTRNTTESINLIAYSYAMENVNAGDEIAVCITEHHSNILPWQMVCKAKNAKLVYMECDKETGVLSLDEVKAKVGKKTKIVATGQVSNVLGITHPIKEIAKIAHANGAVMVVDGAQSAPHMKVDVQDLDADFFALSGHKMCAPMGIGALYGKKEILSKMQPFMRGGEMIEYVTRQDATFAELPHKFEAGTVNAADAVGLAAAIRYLSDIRLENIAEHDNRLACMLIEGLKNVPHVNIIGNPDGNKHCGIVTFTIDGVHPHDIASVLDSEKIAIRAGHHCAQPLGEYLGINSSARASLYFYNTEDEVAVFLEKIKNVRKWMGYKD